MKKFYAIIIILCILLGVSGFLVYQTIIKSSSTQTNSLEPTPTEAQIVQINDSIKIEVTSAGNNSVQITINGLENKISTIAYELTYESSGLIKGVNSGSKPIDVAGKSNWSRDIYLGTCSRNVCKPDAGVTMVGVNIEFVDTDGKKSQFSKEFTI